MKGRIINITRQKKQQEKRGGESEKEAVVLREARPANSLSNPKSQKGCQTRRKSADN